MAVQQDDPRQPYEQVADGLRAQIRNGELVPGAKLPSTQELARTWQVARMTIQRAVGELRDEGLVVSHQGRGVFVSDDPRQASDAPKDLETALQMLQKVNQRLDKLERERDQWLPGRSADIGRSTDKGRGPDD